jgi:hypothetical protein
MTAEVAGWEIAVHPATHADPTVLRRRIPTRIEPAMRYDWAAGLRAGFAENLGYTITIDTTASTPQGSIHSLHTFTDRLGRGHVVDTLARPVADGSDVICHIIPMSRYARDLRSSSSAQLEGEEVRMEAHITMHHKAGQSHGTFLRRADLVRIELPNATDPTWTLTSALPGLLFAGCGLGPRPPAKPLVVLADRPSLTDLLAQLDSQEVHSEPNTLGQAADELTRLARSLTAWWSLEWVRGMVPETLAVDEAWQSATSATVGRLEVLDAGEAGLWRVVTRVPEPLRIDWESDEEPVALCRTNATEVFDALVRLAV